MLYFSRWKTISIWAVVLLGVLFALPNTYPQSLLSVMPDWLPKRQMTLGLDLQGGSHILLKIDTNDLIKAQLESARDEIRTQLRDAKVGYTGLTGTGKVVQVRIRDANQIDAAKEALKSLTQPVSSGMFGSGSVTEMEMDEPEPGLLRFTITDAGVTYRTATALNQSIEVVGRRVNELGTTEPVVQRQGNDRILVQVPGLQDPQRLKDILGQTAKLTFQMVDQSVPVQEAIEGRPPAGSTVMYSKDDPPIPYLIENRVIVSGENLVDSQATFDQRTNEPVVSFRFDSKGASRFGQATQQNTGKLFAIILDNHVISAPRINEPILGGSGQISGSFTPQSANDLAVLLRAGALPANLTIVEERTVGPSLGADSISAGKLASSIGAVLVIVCMLLVYGKLGLIANIALAANVALIVAILTMLGATLTLPGIAGIVLTMGMAVDSNVIIFERVREERAQGRSIVQSFDQGFKQALATVVDANMTTFIVAVILFYMGTGPVKGFAVTLGIGIITTVFTAFTMTRWLVAVWVRRSKPTEFPKGLVHYLPLEPSFPFMRYRNVGFAVSGFLSVAVIAMMFVTDFNYGVDFRGGSMIEMQAKTRVADAADVRSRLEQLNVGDVQVQEFGNEGDLMVRVGAQEAGDNAEQSTVDKVKSEFENDYDFRRVEIVGPTVSSELATTGVIGVVLSMFALLVYIWFRFEWQFGVGAIVSTAHDVIMIVGLYVALGLEFNLSSLAAILTVIGYSINDTVVIYDRIREMLRKYKRMPIEDVINIALNHTMSRTILTGLTVLLALFALYIYGGEVISSFVFAIIIGVFVGTYSSVFIAGPMLILFKLRPEVFGEDAGAKKATLPAATPATKA
ncbi:preprotein translocase subunit SecD [Mesorhizobium sp. Root157]|uniref:protein translocase subunit SecDF n=1 Tax=Mesorhizobium sp. Root157 TaxID=1736477 RepID=UPI000700802A|nr:protein translocase subunit SecDF [Mesorhizobium sp. Root157]KQZ96559.1 preprotein translocase subunit SecD [Mesorhizobium sp. Root157]